jgi:hypothetical protein
MKRDFGHGGTFSFCRPTAGGRSKVRGLPGFRDLAQDRLQIFNRDKDDGLDALTDRSGRPVRYANQLPDAAEATIVRCKQEKPHWGASKIRELLVKRLTGDVRMPAKSTLHVVLDRYGLVGHARNRNRANKAKGTTLSTALVPHDLW